MNLTMMVIDFHPSLSQHSKQGERIHLSLLINTLGALNKISKTNKRFVLLHVGGLELKSETDAGFDIIIEESLMN